MLLFIIIYWTTSLISNLNIGVRHLLPIFPFTIIIVSGVISKIIETKKLRQISIFILSLLFAWQAYSVLYVFPHFLTYFNEAVGGAKNGYKYVVDSNFDWGQDMKRLDIWLEENNINKVYLDYFGGSDAKYHLGDKYMPWWGQRSQEELPNGSYLAISATLLQGGRGEPAKGFNQPTGYYRWLNNYEPVGIIGNSIFVYKISK